MRPFPITLPLCALFGAAACSNGGKQDLPQSEVKIAANHHLMWLRSLPGFAAVSSRADAVFPGHAVLALADDSTYTLTLPTGTTGSERYALANDGALSIYNTGTGREPSTVFQGAYRLVGDQPDLFFTDRVSAGSSTSVGLYYGTRSVPGQVELGGEWHLLSLHLMLSTTGTPLSSRSVARAARGSVTVSGGNPGEVRTLTSFANSAAESTDGGGRQLLSLGGSIQNLLDGTGNGDGSCNLTVTYDNGAGADSRVFRAAAGRDIVMAVDEDESDGEAGLLFLVRKFDAPATPIDSIRVPGDYLIGGHTVFVNPTNNGSDAFVGTLTLTPQLAFRLDAVGAGGIDFSYSGTYAVAADGRITMTVNGTNETWTAAINRTYDTLVLLDDHVETRTNNIPELNIALAVRKKVN